MDVIMENDNAEYSIHVKGLSKHFQVSIHESGIAGRLKTIFHPKRKLIKAVDNISIDIKKGELVGFIGPNGAGKSTTLKMLSGILFPDSGEVLVAGMNPQKKRRQLSYKIGTIFGQKPQLWFHLPPIDSFDLFAKIYDLDQKEYISRRDYLVEKFEIQDILNQPVRKLSLGQRMKCEFVLALLHKPEILFLDEPTIGMDIIARKKIRELIKELNEKEKVTVILTSHDLGDVEDICERLVIINHGKIIYDGTFDNIRKKVLNKKMVSIYSRKKIVLRKNTGVREISSSKFEAELEVDLSKIKLAKFVEGLFEDNDVDDVDINDPPIEEIIERLYRRK